jgi:putative ABC transport system permease protein
MMFRQALAIIGVGLVIGLGGAVAVSRFFRSTLFAVPPTDSPTYVAVSLLLLLAAILACFIPTRRAIAVDPTISLKNE